MNGRLIVVFLTCQDGRHARIRQCQCPFIFRKRRTDDQATPNVERGGNGINQFHRTIAQQHVAGANAMMPGNGFDQRPSLGVRIMANRVNVATQETLHGKGNAERIDAGAEVTEIRRVPIRLSGDAINISAVIYRPFHNVAAAAPSRAARANERHINARATGICRGCSEFTGSPSRGRSLRMPR